jgi:hypothetical protein
MRTVLIEKKKVNTNNIQTAPVKTEFHPYGIFHGIPSTSVS